MTTESRLRQVENELADVTSRLRRLEVEVELPEPQLPPDWGHAPVRQMSAEMDLDELAWPKASTTTTASATQMSRTAVDFEAVFGGRVLAWIGGVAILVAAVLFLGMAISRGWLDEETRTIIAAAIALVALGGGVWLHERRGRTEAARALVASAISGLFGTIVVATQAYSLISPALGLACGAAVAAVGFLIAVRWKSSVVAAIGSLGALTTPALVGVDPSGASIAFVATALAATVGILVWQRWDWLALGAFVVSVPQLIVWASLERHDHLALVIAVLAGFWVLYAGAALGYELRRRTQEVLPLASWLLLFGSCWAFVWPGFRALDGAGHHTAAVVLLFCFAALQIGLGIAWIRLRIHRELGALLVGLGVALTAIGIGEALHGPALVCGWVAAGIVLAGLGSRLDATPSPALSSAERMLVAAGGFLVLAVGHTLIVEAPPSAIFDGVASLSGAVIAISACAIAGFAGAHFARRVSPEGAKVAALVGATSLVYLGSVLIVDTLGVYGLGETRQSGQAWLSAFWTVTAIGAVIVGLVRRQAAVRLGGLALLAVAIVKVWTYDLAELDELARVLSFVGLGLFLLVGSFAYARIKPEARE
ncbi:MAG TPA: DUF2339 domain-containing protein [Solirubrobacterales bacterium]|nr:DUF2339 domain-containing protein [Solirubrobacterales bacterium]